MSSAMGIHPKGIERASGRRGEKMLRSLEDAGGRYIEHQGMTPILITNWPGS